MIDPIHYFTVTRFQGDSAMNPRPVMMSSDTLDWHLLELAEAGGFIVARLYMTECQPLTGCPDTPVFYRARHCLIDHFYSTLLCSYLPSVIIVYNKRLFENVY